jgi:hypothetical protein
MYKNFKVRINLFEGQLDLRLTRICGLKNNLAMRRHMAKILFVVHFKKANDKVFVHRAPAHGKVFCNIYT